MDKYYEKTISSSKKFEGKIIDLETLDVELPDGNKAYREVVRHLGASVIIPIDYDNKLYLVKQFRKAVDKVLIEFPAGKLDSKGEDPKLCGIRELKEETGLTAKEFDYITTIYSAPGIMDEKLHIYVARNLSKGDTDLDDEEFIEVEKYSIEELISEIFKGNITDAKTIVCTFFAEKILDKLDIIKK